MHRWTCFLAIGPTLLFGHDMWVEPTTFWPQAGQIIGVKLRVGQELLGDPIPRSSQQIREFVVADGDGRRPVIGREGRDPAGYIIGPKSSGAVIGYLSHPSRVELEAEKFGLYLKEEGLESVLAARARQNQSGVKARELFSRCAKTLLAGAGKGDQTLGFPLELVAERNPYDLTAGESLPVRLTYQNHPLAGALVVAINRRHPGEKVRIRTGSDGRVRLPLKTSGMWMIKAVHMIPAPAGADADWSSYWASLTFSTGSKY